MLGANVQVGPGPSSTVHALRRLRPRLAGRSASCCTTTPRQQQQPRQQQAPLPLFTAGLQRLLQRCSAMTLESSPAAPVDAPSATALQPAASGPITGVREAFNAAELLAAAELRSMAFYDDLLDRQELPFPKRLLPTFRKEFSEREYNSLVERTLRKHGNTIACRCLVAVDSTSTVGGCMDVSWKSGPCYSLLNGCFVPDGASYAYLDNVCVAPNARRQGIAASMLHAASRIAAAEFSATEVFTHVHVANEPARRLYDQYGFCAPPLAASRQEPFDRAQDRMRGLLLLVAPLPLVKRQASPAAAVEGAAGGAGTGGAAEGEGAVPTKCRCGGLEFGLVCVCGAHESAGAAVAVEVAIESVPVAPAPLSASFLQSSGGF